MAISLRRIFSRGFRPETPEPEKAKDQPRVRESDVAWSYASLVYSLKDFPRYNPDDLIGRKGYKIYRKMMLDEQIKAVVKFRRDAITSRDWFFEMQDSNLPEEEQKRRIRIMEYAVKKMEGSFMDGLNAIMSATYNGFSIVEPTFHLFELDGLSYYGVKRLRLKPFDTFYFTPDEYGNVVRFEQEIAGKRQTLNLKDFIHFVVNPDVDEHYGQSDLREAYRAYFSKDIIIKFRNIWLERHAGGMRWVQSQKEGGAPALHPNSPEYALLKDILENFQSATAAIIPRGLEMHVQNPANQVAFKEAIDDCDLQIARSQLVPNLMGITPSGQTGSYSQSDTQLEAFFWTLDADASRLEECLNEQLFSRLGELNFGDDGIPMFRFKPVSTAKKMEIIKTWRELVASKAVRPTDTDEAHLRELLEMPEAGEPISQPTPVDPRTGLPIQPGQSGEEDDDPPQTEAPNDEPDETIIGRNRVKIKNKRQRRAFLRALQRVDFKVIERRAEANIAEGTREAGRVMGELVLDTFKTIEANNLTDERNQANVAKLKLDGGLKAKLRRVIQSSLKDSWEVGLKHASTEIDKAKGESFSRKVDVERVAMIGAEFFDIKSFTITGKLTDDALASIKTIILNGIKNGRSQKQVMDAIIDRFARDGMLDRQTVLDYFGEAVDYSNPEARLENIIRTNSFEAINEARYAYFTDPALGGFVEALEYSAILDSRTTEICQQLDGHVHPADSDFWDTYMPPNHFNCRSLIVPVTERDRWTETDDEVTLEPQKGFG